MDSDEFHVMPKQNHIGSRTLKDVKAGKIIRIDEDGFENFSDYWTDPDTPQSPSVHVRQGLYPDDRKTLTESLLRQDRESSATLSPFTPSPDEFTTLEINSISDNFATLGGQPTDAEPQITHSTELEVVEKLTKEQSLSANNINKTKTVTRNVNSVESDDIKATVDLPNMVTEHGSERSVQMKGGARAKSLDKDCIESDAKKELKSSHVAASSSCRRKMGISQDPPAEELTKDRSHCDLDPPPVVGSKAIINPVVVLHALSPRCSVVPGTASLTCVSFPLNMNGDIAGSLSRPAVCLPSAEVGQTSPEIVHPTRKRLMYSLVESAESSKIIQGPQPSDISHQEVNRIGSVNVSSTDNRNDTAALGLKSSKVAETSSTVPEVLQNCETTCKELTVVRRNRKAQCHVATMPTDITNVVASVRRSLLLEADTSQSKTFLVEAQDAFRKDIVERIPTEMEIEVDRLQDSDTDTEADNEVVKDGDCFDLFDERPKAVGSLSRVHLLDVVREDDDLVASGKNKKLVSVSSRAREEEEEGSHSDAYDDNDDVNEDDFQMAPLSQANTIKRSYNVVDIKVGSKKAMKVAKPKVRSYLASTVDESEHRLVEEQNEATDGALSVVERQNGTKDLTMQISNNRANKLTKVRKEVRSNKTSPETMRAEDEAMPVDTAKSILKNKPKERKSCKSMKDSRPTAVLTKRKWMNSCDVSDQEDEDSSSEKVNRCVGRTGTVLSQSGCQAEIAEEEEEEDAPILTKKTRKSVIRFECESSSGDEKEVKKEDSKTRGQKMNAVKKVVDTGQKIKSLPSSEKNIRKRLTDALKKNERTEDENERILQPKTAAERTKKQNKGKQNEQPTVLDPASVVECVARSDHARKMDKTLLEEDQARDSRHLMITCDQTSVEATEGTIVSDPRLSSVLENVSNIEPAKSHLGRNLVRYISTPKTHRPSRRHAAAAAVVKQKSSCLPRKVKRKKINSVSRQSVVDVGATGQRTEDDMPDSQNSSELLSDDSYGKRKLRESSTLQEKSLVVTIPKAPGDRAPGENMIHSPSNERQENKKTARKKTTRKKLNAANASEMRTEAVEGVENEETPRMNQQNVAKTPQNRLSVVSRLHYYEGTVSSKKLKNQKQHKIYPPESNYTPGKRRSQRTRVKPLDWFRNERIHYERRKSGFVVAGIYSPEIESNIGVDEKHVKKMIHKETHPEKKRHAEKRRKLSVHADLSHSLLARTQSEIRVLNPQTQEEVFIECIKTADQSKMVGVSGKPPTDDEPLLLCKPIRQKTFASGTLIIRPLQIKKTQFVQNDTMLFHVIHGKVEVTIHQTNFIVESRDKFFVPVGNSYSIRNLRNEDAELDFTQIKS